MRLSEIRGAGLSAFIRPDDPAYLKLVRRGIQAISSSFLDDFADDHVLLPAVANIQRQIEYHSLNGAVLDVWRAELRPQAEVQAFNFSSVGAFWSFEVHAAQVAHHDNAYDSFGRSGLVEIMFEAEVDPRNIDWPRSVAQNLVLPGERELRIVRGAVHVSTVYVASEDHQVDLTLPVTDMGD